MRQKKDGRKGTYKLSYVSPVPPNKGKRVRTRKTWIKKDTAEKAAAADNRNDPRGKRRVVKVRR